MAQWRRHYNTVRPHSTLNYRPPPAASIQPWPSGSASAWSPPVLPGRWASRGFSSTRRATGGPHSATTSTSRNAPRKARRPASTWPGYSNQTTFADLEENYELVRSIRGCSPRTASLYCRGRPSGSSAMALAITGLKSCYIALSASEIWWRETTVHSEGWPCALLFPIRLFQ